jgi:integrase
VFFYINNKRYRLFNGKRINIDVDPNSFPVELRYDKAQLLCAEIYKHLNNGGLFKEYKQDGIISGKLSDIDYLKMALNRKMKSNLSIKYISMLKFVYRGLLKRSNGSRITPKGIESYLAQYCSSTSYNTLRRHLNVLINEAIKLGMESNPMEGIKAVKAKANLNKPFNNIEAILEEIRGFNYNLHLCSILTYGCLLRPHREVRELTWGDFTEDLSFIKLSGNRNKSGRNRIVPVPYYVKELLKKGEPNHNIFSGTTKPLNADYFKTVWGRFKKVSLLLEQDQTLYSFRHSGAINIFKRTGSLSKLQKAMGHSNMMVSMTYLRGLEIAELEESDMPII